MILKLHLCHAGDITKEHLQIFLVWATTDMGLPSCKVKDLINPLSAKFLKVHSGKKWWISDSYCSLKPLWSGMGEVVPARTSPILHPLSLPTVHSVIIQFKVSHCFNCRNKHFKLIGATFCRHIVQNKNLKLQQKLQLNMDASSCVAHGRHGSSILQSKRHHKILAERCTCAVQ